MAKGDYTWPWICPVEFLERLSSLVSDGEQTETEILGCSGLMLALTGVDTKADGELWNVEVEGCWEAG